VKQLLICWVDEYLTDADGLATTSLRRTQSSVKYHTFAVIRSAPMGDRHVPYGAVVGMAESKDRYAQVVNFGR